MISEELQKKLDFYEQYYNGLDKPIPFKDGLELHPILVSDYYKFYGALNCITMDKNILTIPDELTGKMKKVSNPKGLGQSYLAYLIDQMKDPNIGHVITAEVMDLFELVFHIKRGFYCPHCHHEITYEEALEGLEDYIKEAKENAIKIYEEMIRENEEKYDCVVEEKDKIVPSDIMEQIEQKARFDYIHKAQICSECEEEMRDMLTIIDKGGYQVLVVRDVEIGPQEFDEFKAIVPRQNILDYDGDKYIDPELKEELELKAKLQNSDYTAPTLEKQLICVGVATGYTLDYLKSITMRKLSLMLRMVDKKETYYAQLQASMSGMVKFPEGSIKHWIFTDSTRNLKDELTTLDNFEKKFNMVT